MVNFVKCFGKVEIDHVMLMSIEDALDYRVYVLEQMGKTAASFSKTVLISGKNVVGFQMVNKTLTYHSFEDLYFMRCQRDWTVVSSV